jgi:hypothetical protein
VPKKSERIKEGDIVLFHNPGMETTTNLITDVIEDKGKRAIIRGWNSTIGVDKKSLVKIPVDRNLPLRLVTKHPTITPAENKV